MKRVLIIAYFFPPLGGSGSLRPFKLAKYLPRFGWHPTILSVRNPDWYYGRDEALIHELGPQVTIQRSWMLRASWIYRILNPFPNKKLDMFIRDYFLHPDDKIGWIPFAYIRALEIAKDSSFHALFSTSAPLSAHLIAYLIKRKTRLPWIADFRDEWFENPDLSMPTSLHRRLHYALEGVIVRASDKVTTAAPSFSDFLKKHDPDPRRFAALTMGFDPEDFTASVGPERSAGDRKAFTLTFSGLFYRSFTPRNLLAAIEDLIASNLLPPTGIRVKFIGGNSRTEIGSEDRYEVFEFLGFMSHKDAVRHIVQSDALLLLLSKERGKGVIPSKVFEYLATRKPILAIVPQDGEVAGIIRDTGTGFVVDFEDIAGIKQALLQLHRNWIENKHCIPGRDNEKISKYDQFHLTQRLASILDEIVARSGSS